MRDWGLKSTGIRGLSVRTGVALLMASTAIAAPMLAAPAQAQEQAAQTFNIPAQDLGEAVTLFGQQARIQVTAGTGLLAGKRSAEVSGRFSPSEALSRLLAGTGVTFRWTDSNTVALERAPESAEGTIQLGPVRVEGASGSSSSGSSDLAATEGTNSYTSQSMNTATPFGLSIKETPQSVSVVTRDRMNDGAMVTVEDALSYTTGLTIYATGSDRNQYYSRGFNVSNIMVDGLAVDHDSDTIGSASLAMYDRIEIVRGATGLLEGSGNPSASINFMRKRPTTEMEASATTAIGRWNNYLATFDVGGPLNASKTIRARAVASVQDSDTFTSGYGHKRKLFYGILEADLSPSTMVSLGGYYNKEDNPGSDWNGLPTRLDSSFYDFDRSVRASPTWAYWDKENSSIFGELTQTLGGDWKASIKANYLLAKMDMLGTSLRSTRVSDDVFTYNVGKYTYHHNQTSLNGRVTGSVQIFGRDHELAFGASYRRNSRDDDGGWPSSYTETFDANNWQGTTSPTYPTIEYVWGRTGREVEYGGYASFRINIADPLKILLGGRVSWYDYTNYLRSGTFRSTTHYNSTARITPYAGITFDLDRHHSVYGSITGIFNPQNYTSSAGDLLSPVEGTNYELGIKGQYLDGLLNASLAVFQINQTNLPESLPISECSTGLACYAAAGEIRSRGVEAEISGNITTSWRIFAGYTYQKAEYVEDSVNGNAGDPYNTTLPQHLFTFSTVYQLGGGLKNWRIGASARIQSSIFSKISTFSPVRQGGYAIFNSVVGYNLSDNIDIQLNITNVLDKTYYRAVSNPNQANIFGEPRSFLLTGRFKI